MRRVARYLAGRLGDVVHAKSDAAHRARGWEVRRGEWGGRRYRLDVASWLDAQIDRAGNALMHEPARSELPELPEDVRATGAVGTAGTPVGSDVLVRWGRFGNAASRRVDGREVA